MSTTEIWVQHGYGVKATPRRARKERWFHFLTETPVQVPVADAFENERALVLSQERTAFVPRGRPAHWGAPRARKDTWSKGNREIAPSDREGFEVVSDRYGGHGGRLYRPLRAPDDRYGPLTVEGALRENRNERFFDHPFLTTRERKWFHKLEARDDVTNARLNRIHVDTEEARRARVSEAASDLLIVDGALWRAEQMAFVVSLDDEGRRPTLRLERAWFTSTRSGVHFPVDRLEEARGFLESLRAAVPGPGGRPAEVDVDPRFVSEVDPAFARIDGPGLTARTLGNAVHAVAREARHGAAGPVAEAILESLGGDRPYRSLHIVGNPFDFADRIEAWADDILTLPDTGAHDRWELGNAARRLRALALPIVHGRDKGYSAEADAAFFREEDFTGFDLYPDEPGDGSAPGF